MFGMRKKSCLESRKGKHVLPNKWSKPIKVAYKIDAGSFGDTKTEYKYVQTKVCKLCGIIFTNTCCRGEVVESGNVFREQDGDK